MWCRLIIDGNAVYEVDEECMKKKQGRGGEKEGSNSGRLSGPGKSKGSGK